MSVVDYLGMLRRRWFVLALVVAQVLVLVVVMNGRRVPSYSATTMVLVDTSTDVGIIGGQPSAAEQARLVENERSFAESAGLTRLIEPEGFEPDFEAAVVPNANLIELTVSARTPGEASVLADEWAAAYVDARRQDEIARFEALIATLDARIDELRQDRDDVRGPLETLQRSLATATDADRRAVIESQIAILQDSIDPEMALIDAELTALATNRAQADVSRRLGVGRAEVVEPAELPDAPDGVGLVGVLMLGGLVGLLLGLGAVVIAEQLDRSVRSSEEVVALVGAPILAEIPRQRWRDRRRSKVEHAAVLQASDHVGDSFRRAAAATRFVLGEGTSSIMVTSSLPSEGKSTVAANLALSKVASGGLRTILIDLDLRRPRQHDIFSIDVVPGWGDLIADRSRRIRTAASRVAVGGIRLDLVPAGARTEDPNAAIASQRTRSLLADAAQSADFVVVDAPPIGTVSDAGVLCPLVDGVVLVVAQGVVSRSDLAAAVDRIQRSGGRILGVIFSLDTVGRRSRYSYYGDERAWEDRGRVRIPAEIDLTDDAAEASSSLGALFAADDDVDIDDTPSAEAEDDHENRSVAAADEEATDDAAIETVDGGRFGPVEVRGGATTATRRPSVAAPGAPSRSTGRRRTTPTRTTTGAGSGRKDRTASPKPARSSTDRAGRTARSPEGPGERTRSGSGRPQSGRSPDPGRRSGRPGDRDATTGGRSDGGRASTRSPGSTDRARERDEPGRPPADAKRRKPKLP